MSCRFELHIQTIELLDFYGGVAHVPVADYFNAELTPELNDVCAYYPWRPACVVERVMQH